MNTRFFCLLLMVFAASCGDGVGRPYADYEAQLDDYSKIERVENRMRDIAKNWKLEIFEKDRDEMAFVTEGKPALFVALYFDGDPILIVTNVGIGNKLIVTATDHGEMPRRDLEKLTQDVLTELMKLNLEFHRRRGKAEPES